MTNTTLAALGWSAQDEALLGVLDRSVVRVPTKADLVQEPAPNAVSAVTGLGLPELFKTLLDLAPDTSDPLPHSRHLAHLAQADQALADVEATLSRLRLANAVASPSGVAPVESE